MDLRSLRIPAEVTTATAAGIAGIGGSYLVTGGSPEFIAVPVNAVVVAVMPSPVVTFSILFLGTIGEAIGFAIALAVLVGILGVGAVAATRVGRLPWERAWLTGGLVWLIAFGLSGRPWLAIGPAVPAGLVVWALERTGPPTSIGESRRRFLKAMAGTVAFGGIAYFVGSRVGGVDEPSPVAAVLAGPNPDAAQRVDEAIEHRFQMADDAELEVEGVPGLVSSIPEFYEVDINWIDPDLDAEAWSLAVTGQVENEFELGYDEILSMEPEHRFVTLRCVSDPLNGDLMDNAVWTGIPVEPLLERARPLGDQVVLRAADGYFEDFPLAAFEDGFLAYGMNGRTLPRSHGYPVRALVLGHWGEVNVKWVTDLEIVEGNLAGYWEQRGWHGTGPVHPVAKIWGDNRLDDGRLQVYGLAYGGIRGVSAVEVSTDGGETWDEAHLSDPLVGRDVWRQWSYAWPADEGRYQVVARMIDDEGTIQSAERSQPHPSGASGWVRRTVPD